MNLLFDLVATQPVSTTMRHGGGRYGEVIFRRMIERNIPFSCFYDSRKWLNPEIESLCREANVTLYDVAKENIGSIVEKNHITRIYSALPWPLARLNCCEVYGTIHGLRELETPCDNAIYGYKLTWKDLLKLTFKNFLGKTFRKIKRKQFVKHIIDSKLHIITVSNHSKYALYSYFPETKGRDIPVFYSPNTSTKETVVKNGKDKYFFLVSSNRWDKNNLRAIKAFDRLISAGLIDSDIRMKVAGATLSNFRYKPKNINRFDYLGYVDDHELERLYANAFAFVYPSLNEGFGYPPLEAMRYGIPVLASPLTSIPEVCGGSVLYFNPFSVEEIMNRMMMIQDMVLHERYSREGHLRYEEIKARQDRDLDMLIDYIFSGQ